MEVYKQLSKSQQKHLAYFFLDKEYIFYITLYYTQLQTIHANTRYCVNENVLQFYNKYSLTTPEIQIL